jgi:hypothetical protein
MYPVPWSPFSTIDVTNHVFGGSLLHNEIRKHLLKYLKYLSVIGDSQAEPVLMMRFRSSSIRDSSTFNKFLYFSYRLFTGIIDPELNCGSAPIHVQISFAIKESRNITPIDQHLCMRTNYLTHHIFAADGLGM